MPVTIQNSQDEVEFVLYSTRTQEIGLCQYLALEHEKERLSLYFLSGDLTDLGTHQVQVSITAGWT